MPTAATSLTLRALFSRTATRASLDTICAGDGGIVAGGQGAMRRCSPAGRVAASRVLVVPTDKDVEQMTADARFFYGAMEGASAAVIERGRGAVSVAADRSVSGNDAALPCLGRPRACAALRGGRHRPAGHRVGRRRCCPRSAHRIACCAPRWTSARGPRSSRRRSPTCSLTPGSPGRIRSTNTARSPFEAASSTSFRLPTLNRFGSSSSATWSKRSVASILRRSGRPAPLIRC